MLTVAWNYPYFIGIIRVLIHINMQAHRLALVGFAFMLNLFKEHPIEYQIREFSKSKYGTRSHAIFIEEYKRFARIKCISGATYENIEAFRQHKSSTTTVYTTISAIQALRSFIRYHKRLTNIKPQYISDMRVFTPVGEIATIKLMEKKKKKAKMGRPRDKESIKKVRLLKEKGGLSFRAISVAMKKDVKTVYSWYRFSVEDDLLAK